MRLLFETKDEGRRFVNLALKENNPFWQHHLIPSHHTKGKYHSSADYLSKVSRVRPSGPVITPKRQLITFYIKVLNSFCNHLCCSLSCSRPTSHIWNSTSPVYYFWTVALFLVSDPSISSFQLKSHKLIFVFQSYLV